MNSRGFSILELVVAIALLGLLAFSIILAVNPIERAKIQRDEKWKGGAESTLASIDQFLIAKGRLPWSDDFGSEFPISVLPWTPAHYPEIGVCGDSQCSGHGELISEGFSPNFGPKDVQNAAKEDIIYLGRGKDPQAKIYACYLPLSEKIKRATGKLYKITPGAHLPASGVPEECPLSPSWTGEDVCYFCVAK